MIDKDALPNFEGKCLSVSLIDNEESHDLLEPRFEWQAGRLFLVGQVPAMSTQSDWTAGCPTAIAWDRVEGYVVFDNEAAFLQAVEVSEKHFTTTES